jgi:acetolactate synthase-1/2/3 large subunit
MKGIEAIARILKREGVEYLFCFPINPLIDAAAAEGIRPIMTRTERTLVNMADGYTRVSSGGRRGVCAVQSGAGIENSFAGVAQAHSDSVPILILPGHRGRMQTALPPNFEATPNYAGITKWVAQINEAQRIPEMMRRAFTLLRNGQPSPVILEILNDVADATLDGEDIDYEPPSVNRSAGDPQAIEAAVEALLTADRPLLHVGQGVLQAEAWEELQLFAELLQAPVLTTIAGKSAFPENHPLSAGTAGYTSSGVASHVLEGADLVFGVGTSFSSSLLSTSVPPGKTMLQATINEHDLNKVYPIDYAIIGDVKLILQQMIAAIQERRGPEARRAETAVADEIRQVKESWLAEWMPKLTSDEVPINPYRVVWDLMQAVDRTQTIVTHDSGNPRDQILPFYETLIPHGYIGWGKSTQLGYSLGLAMGAKLGQPDKLVINFMGDAAIGMAGMDLETAVRERIPILTILLNNGALGGYEKHMPVATERYRTKFLSGSYATVAQGLGVYSERVEQPVDIIPAIERAKAAIANEQPALLEIMTREEGAFSHQKIL